VTVLTIAQAVADEVGIPRPSSLVGSTDDTARQLLALLNREGQDLIAAHDWAACQRDKTVTVTSGTATYAVPTDFAKIIDDTMWDTTNKWPMLGPLNSTEWAMLLKGISISTPRRIWRLVGKSDGTYSGATAFYVQIAPTPTNSTDTFYYEYISNGFARKSADASAGVFDDDADIPILPEQLFILGGIWRFLRAKGLPYDEEKDAYEREVARCMAQDKSARVLSLSNRSTFGPRFLNYDNVPETGFGD
jgi:hypothetical protein